MGAVAQAEIVCLWDGEIGASEYRVFRDARGAPSYAEICQPSPLPGWRFSRAEHHPATPDGDCMAGPTPEYYRVWATPNSAGEGTIGCGATAQEALDKAVARAREKQAALDAEARGSRILEIALGVMSGRLTAEMPHADLLLLMGGAPHGELTNESLLRRAERVVYLHLLPEKPTGA